MEIAVLGIGQTKFGELWNDSLSDLLAKSQFAAINDAQISVSDIDAIFTGNMCAPLFSNQTNVGSLATQILGKNVQSFLVEGACASGGLALRAGVMAIESGRANVVLVNGVEKMTDIGAKDITRGLMSATCSDWEQIYGATFPAFNAMIARLYMHTYGLTREQLALVSIQNHDHGFLNKFSHLRKKITTDDVLQAPIVSDPLTLFDCSPISDGAASVILCRKDFLTDFDRRDPVCIVGSGHATDTLRFCERDDFLTWKATSIAAKNALEESGLCCEDVDVLELHDGFSITQILTLEDLGFVEKGRGISLIEDGSTRLGSHGKDPIVNPSGGLKSRGHPVGATGVCQAVEIVKQLRGTSGDYQVEGAKVGMTQNAGGCGSNVVVHLFKRGL